MRMHALDMNTCGWNDFAHSKSAYLWGGGNFVWRKYFL